MECRSLLYFVHFHRMENGFVIPAICQREQIFLSITCKSFPSIDSADVKGGLGDPFEDDLEVSLSPTSDKLDTDRLSL